MPSKMNPLIHRAAPSNAQRSPTGSTSLGNVLYRASRVRGKGKTAHTHDQYFLKQDLKAKHEKPLPGSNFKWGKKIWLLIYGNVTPLEEQSVDKTCRLNEAQEKSN